VVFYISFKASYNINLYTLGVIESSLSSYPSISTNHKTLKKNEKKLEITPKEELKIQESSVETTNGE
jgi:hypothetical protein